MEFQHEAVAFEKEQTRQDWYLNWISGRIGLKFTFMSEMGHKKENKLNWHGGRPSSRKKLLYQTPLWFSSEHGWASTCSGTPAAVGARDFWAGGSAWGGNCIKWLMRPFAETCRIWSSFAMHSICRISIRNSSKQFTTCPSNSKKQLMSSFLMWVDILDFGWHSVFPGWCISGKGAAKEWVEEFDPREEDWYSRRGEQNRMLQDLWEHVKVGSLIYPSHQKPSCTYFLFAIRRLWRQQKLKSRNFWHLQMSLAKFSGFLCQITDGRNDGCS